MLELELIELGDGSFVVGFPRMSSVSFFIIHMAAACHRSFGPSAERLVGCLPPELEAVLEPVVPRLSLLGVLPNLNFCFQLGEMQVIVRCVLDQFPGSGSHVDTMMAAGCLGH